jgi:hypothetical protein
VQEALHPEAVEDAVELQVAALGVPQVEQAGLEFGGQAA